MAVNLNDFNKLTEQLAGNTSKQAAQPQQQLQKDIKAEESQRQDAYDKTMGPLTALISGDFGRFGEAVVEQNPDSALETGGKRFTEETVPAHSGAVQAAEAENAQRENDAGAAAIPAAGGSGEAILPAMIEKRIEINPYQREAYTGTQTLTPEIPFNPGTAVEPEYKTTITDNSATPSQAAPDYVPDPVVPVLQDTASDYTGGNQSIGFQAQEAYTPETIVEAPQKAEGHNWAEYLNNRYGAPLVYSDEQLKVKYFTVPKGKQLKETFKRLSNGHK